MRRPETSMATTAANLPALCGHDVAGLDHSSVAPPQQCSTSYSRQPSPCSTSTIRMPAVHCPLAAIAATRRGSLEW